MPPPLYDHMCAGTAWRPTWKTCPASAPDSIPKLLEISSSISLKREVAAVAPCPPCICRVLERCFVKPSPRIHRPQGTAMAWHVPCVARYHLNPDRYGWERQIMLLNRKRDLHLSHCFSLPVVNMKAAQHHRCLEGRCGRIKQTRGKCDGGSKKESCWW